MTKLPLAAATLSRMQWFRDRRSPGRPPHPDVLTPAEWRVLEEIRQGRTNAEIAATLGVSVNTVRTHVSRILAKLDLPDRHAVAAWRGRPAVEAPSTLRRRTTAVALALGGAAAATAAVALLLASMQGASAPASGGPEVQPPPPAGATETANATAPGGEPRPALRLAVGCLVGLCLVHADGSGLLEVPEGLGLAAWSPDGTRLAGYTHDGAREYLAVMDADGSNRRVLTELGGVHIRVPPAWSPDGSTIAVEDGPETPVDGIGGSRIRLVDVATGETRMLVEGPEPYTSNAGPRWSPGGSRLVFTSDRSSRGDVFVIDADGDGPTQLTSRPHAEGSPEWLDDGRIAYYSHDTRPVLMVMDADGSNARPLADLPGGAFSTPHGHDSAAVSPDGSRVAFLSETNGQIDLFIVEVTTGDITRLTDDAAAEAGPSWSPDGRYLAYATFEAGDAAVWIAAADGSYLERLDAPGGRPAWAP